MKTQAWRKVKPPWQQSQGTHVIPLHSEPPLFRMMCVSRPLFYYRVCVCAYVYESGWGWGNDPWVQQKVNKWEVFAHVHVWMCISKLCVGFLRAHTMWPGWARKSLYENVKHKEREKRHKVSQEKRGFTWWSVGTLVQKAAGACSHSQASWLPFWFWFL